ncbi:uncharacterized protein LOC135805712 [Sycon ciliatum]|uniref:uncharacterized protein LOC135805712 n=1 Tax=Sycon ciliatum TaxID=27933 RepID=UPI0031F673AD
MDAVNVAVRLRPLLPREPSDAVANWKLAGRSITCAKVPNASFTFDHVFDQTSTNSGVFEAIAKPIVQSTLAGFHGTIFAYGQTSSGKTHTMMGSNREPGIIHLALDEIFNIISESANRMFLIRVSFLEIYNECITDLLNPGSTNLKVHENAQREVYVGDVREENVTSIEEVLRLLKFGEKNRHIGCTDMNERSSRSHTIFRMTIESRECEEAVETSDDAIRVATLNLVDLAGSERASATGADGMRLKEGGFINRSLFILSNVINKIADGDHSHIPFRDSKLTRILQTSLGGNARTAILCAATPASIEETIGTLRFATRAKTIKNKPVVNEVMTEAAQLKRYHRELAELRRQVAMLQQERDTHRSDQIKILEARIIQPKAVVVKRRKNKEDKRRHTLCPEFFAKHAMEADSDGGDDSNNVLSSSFRNSISALPAVTTRRRDSKKLDPLVSSKSREEVEFESEAGVVDFSLGTAATIEELNQKNEELQQALQEKEEEFSELQQNMVKLEAFGRNLVSDLEIQLEEKDALLSEMEAAQQGSNDNGQQAMLQQQLEEVCQERDGWKLEVSAMAERLQTLEEERQQLDQQQASRELVEEERQRWQAELDAMAEKLQQVEDENRLSLEQQSHAFSEERTNLQTELVSMAQQVQQYDQETRAALEKQSEEFDQERQKWQAEVDLKTQQMQQSHDEIRAAMDQEIRDAMDKQREEVSQQQQQQQQKLTADVGSMTEHDHSHEQVIEEEKLVLQAEISSLAETVCCLEENTVIAAKRHQEERQSWQAETGEMNQKICDLQAECDQLQQQFQGTKKLSISASVLSPSQFEFLENEHSVLETRCQALECEVANFSEKAQRLEFEKAELELKLKSPVDVPAQQPPPYTCNVIPELAEELPCCCQKLTCELAELGTKLQHSESTLDGVVKQHQHHLQQVEQNFNSQINFLNDAQDAMMAQETDYRERIAELKRESGEMRQQIQLLKSSESVPAAGLCGSGDAAGELRDRCIELEEQCQQLLSDCAVLDKKCNRLTTVNTMLEEQAAVQHDVCTCWQEKLKEAESKCDQLASQLAAKEAELLNAHSQPASAPEKDLYQLESALEKAKSQLAQLTADNEQLKDSMMHLQETASAADRRCRQYQSELDQVKESICESDQAKHWEQQWTDSNKQCQLLLSKLEEQTESAAAQDERCNHWQQKWQETDSQCSQLQAELDQQKHTASAQDEACNGWRTKWQEAQQQCSSLQQELDQVKATSATQNELVQQWQQQCLDIEERCQSLQSELQVQKDTSSSHAKDMEQQWQQQEQETKNKLENLHNVNQKLQEAAASHENVVEQWQQQYQQMEEDCRKARDALKEQQDVCTSQGNSVSRLKEKCQEAENQCHSLQAELDTLRESQSAHLKEASDEWQKNHYQPMEEQCKRLQAKLDEQMQVVATHVDRAKGWQAQSQEKEEQCQKLLSEVNEQKVSIAAHIELIEIWQKQFQESEEKCERLQYELNTLGSGQESHAAELRQQCVDAEIKLKETSTEKEQLEADCTQLKLNVQSQAEEVAKLRGIVDEVDSELTDEVAKNDARRREQESRIDDLSKQLVDVSEQYSQLQLELEQQTTERTQNAVSEDLQRQCQEAEEKLNSVRSQNQQLEAACQQHKSDQQTQAAEVLRLQTIIDEVDNELSEESEKNKRARQEQEDTINDLRQQLSTATQGQAAAQDQESALSDLQAQLSSLTQHHSESQQEIGRLQGIIDEVDNELAEEVEKNNIKQKEQNEQIHSLQKQISNTMASHAELQRELEQQRAASVTSTQNSVAEDYRHQLQGAEAKLSNVLAENEKLELTYKTQQAENQALEEEINRLKGFIDDADRELTAEVETNDAKRKEQDNQMRDLQKEILDMKKMQAEMQSRLDQQATTTSSTQQQSTSPATRSKLTMLKARLGELERTIQRLQAENDMLKRKATITGKEEGAPRFAGIGLDTKSIVTEAGAFTLKIHCSQLEAENKRLESQNRDLRRRLQMQKANTPASTPAASAAATIGTSSVTAATTTAMSAVNRSTGTIAAASTTNTSMVDSALHSSTLSRQAKPTAATQPPSLSSAVREPRLRESREPTRAPVPASSPASTTASAEVTAPAATDYDQTSASIVSMSMASGIHSDAAVSSTDEEGGNVTSAGGQARRRSPRLLQSALVTRRPLGDDNQADRREQQSKRDLGHGAMCNKPGDEDEPRHSERQRSEKGDEKKSERRKSVRFSGPAAAPAAAASGDIPRPGILQPNRRRSLRTRLGDWQNDTVVQDDTQQCQQQ